MGTSAISATGSLSLSGTATAKKTVRLTATGAQALSGSPSLGRRGLIIATATLTLAKAAALLIISNPPPTVVGGSVDMYVETVRERSLFIVASRDFDIYNG